MTDYMPAADLSEIILLDPRDILIDPNKKNNRYGGHDQKAIKKMAASLQQEGQLQPIIVRPITPAPVAGGKRFEAIVGFRRLLAALLIRKKKPTWKIKVVVAETSDEGAFMYNVAENLHRQSLSPIDKGLAMKKAIEEFGWTQARVAKYFGVGQPYVSRLLSIISLPKSVLDQVHNKQLNVDAAYKASQLPPEKAKIIAPVPEYPEQAVRKRNERSAIIAANAMRAAGKTVKPGVTSVVSLVETLMNSVQRECPLWYIAKAIIDYSEGRLSRTEAVCRIKNLL